MKPYLPVASVFLTLFLSIIFAFYLTEYANHFPTISKEEARQSCLDNPVTAGCLKPEMFVNLNPGSVACLDKSLISNFRQYLLAGQKTKAYRLLEQGVCIMFTGKEPHKILNNTFGSPYLDFELEVGGTSLWVEPSAIASIYIKDDKTLKMVMTGSLNE